MLFIKSILLSAAVFASVACAEIRLQVRISYQGGSSWRTKMAQVYRSPTSIMDVTAQDALWVLRFLHNEKKLPFRADIIPAGEKLIIVVQNKEMLKPQGRKLKTVATSQLEQTFETTKNAIKELCETHMVPMALSKCKTPYILPGRS